MSGTFEEWHPTGDRVVKVIGSNYEIIAGSSNVVIKGDVNLTMEGTKKELIKGDYILEVDGDYTRKIHKNERVKIGASAAPDGPGPGGNLETEVGGNWHYNIHGTVGGKVKKDQDVIIEGNESRTINGYFDGSIVGNYTVTSLADINITAKTNMSLKTVSGIVAVSAGSNVNVRSTAAMKIKSGGVYTLQSVGAAHETFDSTYYVDYKGLNEFDHSGDWRVMKGANYYARHAAGIDHACSEDPVRTSANDCTDPTTPTLP